MYAGFFAVLSLAPSHASLSSSSLRVTLALPRCALVGPGRVPRHWMCGSTKATAIAPSIVHAISWRSSLSRPRNTKRSRPRSKPLSGWELSWAALCPVGSLAVWLAGSSGSLGKVVNTAPRKLGAFFFLKHPPRRVFGLCGFLLIVDAIVF